MLLPLLVTAGVTINPWSLSVKCIRHQPQVLTRHLRALCESLLRVCENLKLRLENRNIELDVYVIDEILFYLGSIKANNHLAYNLKVISRYQSNSNNVSLIRFS